MAVSATTLRVQEFDKGRGPVGLPPIGQACDLPEWPDQGLREGSLVKFPERPSASCWALFIIIIGAIIATLCCYLIIRIGDHTGGSDTVKTREIATGLGLAVGALAGMFYDAVPKFSYAFIARMTIHYHYETIFPNTPNNKGCRIPRGPSSSYGSGRGEHSLSRLMVGVWFGAVPIAAGSSEYSCRRLDDYSGPAPAHTHKTGDGRPFAWPRPHSRRHYRC